MHATFTHTKIRVWGLLITMNIKATVTTYQQWIVRFIQLQLFLSLMSLPIMLAWGLPVSLLSPLGNLIFGPILTVFLFLSSLIFFAELLMIPNSLLINVMETLTHWWLTIMFSDQQRFLVGFSKPSIIVLCIIPIIAMIIMLNKTTAHHYKNIGCLAALFLTITFALKYTVSTNHAIIEIPCNNGFVTILKTSDQLILIDPGFIGQRTSATSWVSYTLIPSIIKATGSTVIDHCIILQPNILVFEALEQLSTKIVIRKLYIPYWQQQKPSKLSYAFCSCVSTAQKQGTAVIRIGKSAHHITLRRTDSLIIQPLETLLTTKNSSYCALSVAASVDNQNITLYSAKYAKKLISSSNEKHNNLLNTIRVEDGNQ